MPTKEEMIAFFKRYRAQDADSSAPPRVEAHSQKVATDAANAVASSVLTQVDRVAPPLVPSRPVGNSNHSSTRIRHQCGGGTSPSIPEDFGPHVLPPPLPIHTNRITLVLDVDETLVHSSFKACGRYDLQLPLYMNGQHAQIFVRIRPHLASFLTFAAAHFEVVVFTASMSLYCNPLMDVLDPERKLGSLRLFREHCVRWNGAFVKDLRTLGRPLERVAIIDNSPAAYVFQPRNAIPVVSWFDDPEDHELRDLIPFLKRLAECDSVYEPIERHNAKLHP